MVTVNKDYRFQIKILRDKIVDLQLENRELESTILKLEDDVYSLMDELETIIGKGSK